MMFPGLGRLPQGEVPGRILVVFVEIHTGAVADGRKVLLGQLAVLRKSGYAEIPGAVGGLIGQVLGRQPLDQGHHLGDVFGGPRHDLRALAVQRVQILKKMPART